jgi:1-acyl-sn-glycerol-3-phosphate acyltransferase
MADATDVEGKEGKGEKENDEEGHEAWRARLPSPVHPPTRFEWLLYRTIRAALIGLSRVWFRLEVVDKDRMPASGPFVLAPVHRSNIDFFLVAALTRTRMRYMGKDSLWKVPLLGPFIATLGAFPVRRGKADREALRTCMTIIENGEPLVMFPEGTRREGPLVVDLYDGVAYLALKAGVTIVPVGIGGSETILGRGRKFPRLKRVSLVVGEPILPPETSGGTVRRRDVAALTERLRVAIQSAFDEAQALL